MSTEHRDSPRHFETEITIDAHRDAVFRALTDATRLSRWFAPKNAIDPSPGGAVLWEWEGHFSWPQQIEVVTPGARLRTRYDSTVAGDDGAMRPLFVDFVLEGEAGTTTLRLVHSGFGDESSFDEEFDGISKGWPIELQSLRLYLERHADQDRQLVWSRTQTSESADRVWERLIGTQGLRCGAALSTLEPGAPFQIDPVQGEGLTGKVVTNTPREFVGIASSHGDAFLRFWVGEWGGKTHIWLWLAMYGQPSARVEAEQQRFDAWMAVACSGQEDAQEKHPLENGAS